MASLENIGTLQTMRAFQKGKKKNGKRTELTTFCGHESIQAKTEWPFFKNVLDD